MITLTLPLQLDVLRSAAAMLEDICDSLDVAATNEIQAATNEPVAATEPELDSAGIPWDPRIHSSKKTRLAKTGRWKRMRGVDTALADSIEADFLPEQDDLPMTFPELMKVITDSGLSPDQVQACVVSCGLPNLPSLTNQMELIPQVAECIKQTVPQ